MEGQTAQTQTTAEGRSTPLKRREVFLTPKQAADALGVSPAIVDRIAKNGDLHAKVVGEGRVNLPHLNNKVYIRQRYSLTEVETLRKKIEQGSYNPYRWRKATEEERAAHPGPKRRGIGMLQYRITELHNAVKRIEQKLGIPAPTEGVTTEMGAGNDGQR